MRPLSRRALIALGAALTIPQWARGQSAGRAYRLGWLASIDSFKEPQQPTTYELAINAATARKLGIRIPESIRIRVDRVIDHQIARQRVGDAAQAPS